MYHLTGYIHHKKMGPHNLISFTRWTIKWTIMSKNDRGKYIANWKDNGSLILQIIQLSRVNDFATDSIKNKAQTCYGNPNFVRQDSPNR